VHAGVSCCTDSPGTWRLGAVADTAAAMLTYVALRLGSGPPRLRNRGSFPHPHHSRAGFMDPGEATFTPELIRTDQVPIGEAGAAVHVGETVIHFADDAYITPAEARKLAEALGELADHAEGLR
jgi:hypothetical protein